MRLPSQITNKPHSLEVCEVGCVLQGVVRACPNARGLEKGDLFQSIRKRVCARCSLSNNLLCCGKRLQFFSSAFCRSLEILRLLQAILVQGFEC